MLEGVIMSKKDNKEKASRWSLFLEALSEIIEAIVDIFID